MSNNCPAIIKKLIALLILVIVVALAARLSYKLPVKDTILFILSAGLVFYIPGALISRLCCSNMTLSAGIVPSIAISLGTGLSVATVYMHAHYELNLSPWLGITLLLVCVLIDAAMQYAKYRSPTEPPKREHLPLHKELLPVIVLIVSLLLMLSMSHYADVTLVEDGYRYWQQPYNETLFHEGLINALNEGYPPRSLYMSGGIDFSYYHLGMHLQVHLLEQVSGIDLTKLIYFYFSTFYFFLIGTLGYSIAKLLGAGSTVALVTGLLLFGSDFSFVTGLASMKDIQPYPWIAWNNPVVFSLFTYNGMLPGLIAFLCFTVYLIELFRRTQYRILLVLLCITYSAYLTKSTMGFQIAAVGAFICLLASFKLGRRLWLVNAAGFLLTLGWMLYVQGLHDNFTGDAPMSIQPFNMFQLALERYELTELATYLLIPVYFSYLILTMGLRYLGYHVVVDLKESDFDPSAGEASWIILYFAIFCISGFILSEMIVIGNPLQPDNSIWFATQSLFSAWFLVSIYLIRLEKKGSQYTTLAPLLILAIAYTSTIQFLLLRTNGQSQATFFDHRASEKEMISALRLLENDAVVLHPTNHQIASLSANFAGKETVLTNYYSFITDSEEFSLRKQDVENYFSITASADSRVNVLEKYNVTHVLCPVGQCGDFEGQPKLHEILANDSYRLFGKEIRHIEN